jgi:transposase
LELILAENSSGGRPRLGHISKQGNVLLRRLLVEARHVAAQHDPQLRWVYCRLSIKRSRAIAAVAAARKLAVRLWWMWIRRVGYEQLRECGSHAG